jgi:hypothetical protein
MTKKQTMKLQAEVLGYTPKYIHELALELGLREATDEEKAVEKLKNSKELW